MIPFMILSLSCWLSLRRGEQFIQDEIEAYAPERGGDAEHAVDAFAIEARVGWASRRQRVLRCGYGFEGRTPTRDFLVMLKNVFGHAMPRGLPLCGEVVSAPRFIAYTIGMDNAFRNRNQGRRDIACSRR